MQWKGHAVYRSLASECLFPELRLPRDERPVACCRNKRLQNVYLAVAMGTTFRKPAANVSSSVNAAVFGKPDSRRRTPTKSARPDFPVSQPGQVGVVRPTGVAARPSYAIGLASQQPTLRSPVPSAPRCRCNFCAHRVLSVTVLCPVFPAAAAQ